MPNNVLDHDDRIVDQNAIEKMSAKRLTG